MTNNATKLQQFPALEEMGITRPLEISRYSLRVVDDSRDELKIFYKRAKGSLLPFSRKYKFGRSMKTVIADGGTARMEQTYEISPFLLQAVKELDSLVAPANADLSGDDTEGGIDSEQILADLVALEELVMAQSNLTGKEAVSARFASLKTRLSESA